MGIQPESSVKWSLVCNKNKNPKIRTRVYIFRENIPSCHLLLLLIRIKKRKKNITQWEHDFTSNPVFLLMALS